MGLEFTINDVVIILASTAADLIDPAILRLAASTGKSKVDLRTRRARVSLTAFI